MVAVGLVKELTAEAAKRAALGAGAKVLGLTRVLVTCDRDNASSARVIEKNGGVFESEVEFDGAHNRRYWIELRTVGSRDPSLRSG